jgi:hypothetical protein
LADQWKSKEPLLEILDKEVRGHLTEKLFSLKRLALLLREFAKEMRGQAKRTKDHEAAIHSAIRDNERKLENIYSLIEQGKVSESNLDERIAQRRNKIRLLQRKLDHLREQKGFSLPPHVFSASFLEKFRSRLRKALYSDPYLAKTYLRFFLTKIVIRGRNVTLVGRKDILTRAIIANDEENLVAVPTAGGMWLPLLDTFRTIHWAKIKRQVISLGITSFLLTTQLGRKGTIQESNRTGFLT